jgi:PAS domain S-box-containing protein
MPEHSGDRSADDVATLRVRIEQLQTLLAEERAKRKRAEDALQRAGSGPESQVRDEPFDATEPDRRVQEEINKRRRVKVALQDSEALYHSLVENLPICVYRIDLEGRVTFGNSAYLKDLGQSLDELSGKTVFDMFPEGQAKKYDADDRRVIETGQVFHDVEEHYVRGEKMYVEVLKCPVHDHEGRTVGIQGLYWDVTARWRAEEQLRKSLAELARSNADLHQFAGAASHDLHAPLRRIVTLVEFIREDSESRFDAETEQYLAYIVSSAEHMQELIHDLLAHSRVGALDEPLELVECDMVVQNALSNLADSVRESRAHVQAEHLPRVMGNRVELTQLFQNLIGNAIKYRGEEPPHVYVHAESREDDWLFRVVDNGIGIAPEHHEGVFEAFRRLHGDEDYPGTGIGLATCKKIVERLDGSIWVESEVGQGSTFLFTLPRRGLSVS